MICRYPYKYLAFPPPHPFTPFLSLYLSYYRATVLIVPHQHQPSRLKSVFSRYLSDKRRLRSPKRNFSHDVHTRSIRLFSLASVDGYRKSINGGLARAGVAAKVVSFSSSYPHPSTFVSFVPSSSFYYAWLLLVGRYFSNGLGIDVVRWGRWTSAKYCFEEYLRDYTIATTTSSTTHLPPLLLLAPLARNTIVLLYDLRLELGKVLPPFFTSLSL